MLDYGEVLKKLSHLEQLLVVLTRTHLEPVLQKEFADPRMRKLYDLTGTHSQRELKKELNMSANTISDAWKRWEQMGLLAKEGQEYRRVI